MKPLKQEWNRITIWKVTAWSCSRHLYSAQGIRSKSVASSPDLFVAAAHRQQFMKYTLRLPLAFHLYHTPSITIRSDAVRGHLNSSLRQRQSDTPYRWVTTHHLTLYIYILVVLCVRHRRLGFGAGRILFSGVSVSQSVSLCVPKILRAVYPKNLSREFHKFWSQQLHYHLLRLIYVPIWGWKGQRSEKLAVCLRNYWS